MPCTVSRPKRPQTAVRHPGTAEITRNGSSTQYAVKKRESVPPGPMRICTGREHFGQHPS